MRSRCNKLLIAATIAICLLALVSGEQSHAKTTPGEQLQSNTDGSSSANNQSPRFKLPKLFDFEHFKERFGKKYATLSEELARKTYFVARAFRAFVSGMNFKWRRSSYYLAVNHMSDASPQELEAGRNKILAESHRERHQRNETLRMETTPDSAVDDDVAVVDDDLPEFLPAEGENYEEAVQKLLEEHRDEPGYRELVQEAKIRKKRSLDAATTLGPRDFSLDKLIKPGVKQVLPELPGVLEKITNNVESNNPDYQPPEILTMGLNDDHEDLTPWKMKPKKDKRSISKQLHFSLSGLARRVYSKVTGRRGAEKKSLKEEAPAKEEDAAGDVMYFDHRDSQCLTRPRAQGNCGSCYAFAATALMEWLYCTKKGVLVPFSEQYMVDCGNRRFKKAALLGCEGATDYGVFKFLNNFGVERRWTYPYVARDQECPYDESTDLKAAGYIKMKLNDFTAVPVSRWAEYIQYGPLYMSIATPKDYNEYSGGVHDGKNCGRQPDHAQLLVGHGREDGQDFWLIRNSYGTNWGDDGYFKLSKDAPKRCIEDQVGFALGTTDARSYNVKPKVNIRNRELLEARRRKFAELEEDDDLE